MSGMYEIRDVSLLRGFYMSNFPGGSDDYDEWSEKEGVIFSFADCEEEALKSGDSAPEVKCAFSVSIRKGIVILDYIAVDRALRGKGIGSSLIFVLKNMLRQRGIGEIYLSARVPDFFEKNGAIYVDEKEPASKILLGECFDCPSYNRECFPKIMKFSM